ncbi:MAG: hypothetical protein N4A45_10480 [Flavobacteriales bacterium]|jgi:hypothetical protein|nr:hypothetical protein [Flavobacteriales bacterium]
MLNELFEEYRKNPLKMGLKALMVSIGYLLIFLSLNWIGGLIERL